MKRKICGVFLFSAAVSLLVGCGNEDNPWGVSGSEGSLKLELASDGSVYRSTRADDTQATKVPGVSEFKVALSKNDGSFSKEWQNIGLFNKETVFPGGDYLIEASYGDIDTEGFDSPYFYASQEVSVKAGDETRVNLTATMANCMVSVRYTDEFKQNFSSYSAALRSEGHDYVVLAQEETRPVYMSPSKVELSLTLTNAAGKKVTVQPAGFVAEERHHYVVTIGVNGDASMGSLKLDISFEENVEEETIDIPLGDELFNAPAPTVEARDFISDQMDDHIQDTPYDESVNPRFHLFAFAGFAEARLIVNSTGYTPPFGAEIDLLKADDLQKAQVSESGLEVTGLFRNPDKMATVGLRKFVEKLPEGEYEVLMSVKDAMMRVNDVETAAKFKVKVTKMNVIIVPAGDMKFNSKEHDFYVFSNFKNIMENSSFRRLNAENKEVDLIVDASAVEAVSPGTLGYGEYEYGYKGHFKIPDDAFASVAIGVQKDNCPLRLYFKNETVAKAEAPLKLAFPKYTLKADAMAKKVKILIIPENKEDLGIIKSNLVILADGKNPTNKLIVRSGLVRNDVIEVHELESSSNYTNVSTTLGNSSNYESFKVDVPPFTTETELSIPNGDFSVAGESFVINDIQVGCSWKATGSMGTRTNKSGINRVVPAQWSSVNAKTCFSGASNKNSWYVVPSTFAENGVATVRTVGYNENGKDLGTSGSAFTTGIWYGTNVPEAGDLKVARGEFFLGSYSYDGSNESRSEGVLFSSRPRALRFEYIYSPVNDESAGCIVELKKGDAVISTTRMTIPKADGWTEQWVDLNVCPFDDGESGDKITSVSVKFLSTSSSNTNPAINIPSGSALEEGSSLYGSTITTNQYKALAVGSVLQLRNVEFMYTTKSHASMSGNVMSGKRAKAVKGLTAKKKSR